MRVGEVEEGLGVVHDDYHPLSDIVFTVGGAYEALDINDKCAINMGTRLPLKIHKRGEGAVKPGRHRFVPKVRTEDIMMDFLNRFTGGEK